MKKTNQYTRWLLALFVLAAVIILPIVLTRKPNPGAFGGSEVNVVAAENFWGNIVSQIGGDHVKIASIITDPSTDPHLYESNARNAAEVASADLVITNGLGYDDFIDRLLSASTNKNRQVLRVAQILGLSGNEANPHLWYDIPHVADVATQFEEALAAKDAAHKAEFEQNLAQFKDSLKPLQDELAQIKSKYPGAPVAYTEPVPGYLLANAGLTVKTPAGFSAAIEEGSDPSPADSATMDNLMTTKSVKVLLYNSQATSPVTEHVRDLAKQYGIPVVGVTETLPANEKTYQSWQLDQLSALLTALGQ